MKHIAKTRRDRLLAAASSLASSVRRNLATRAAPAAGTRSGRTGPAQITRSMRASSSGSRLSLVPAHAGHFEWMAGILRDGAQAGSFDPELAVDSVESRLFFANLRHALETGYFLAAVGAEAPSPTPASGYVCMFTSRSRGAIPLGFTLFKSIGDLGFEIWLVGVDRRYRGRGFGKAMLHAVLATPAGMLAHVARVNRAGLDCETMSAALRNVGYRQARDGQDVRWFVREDAPTAVLRAVRDGSASIGQGG